MTTQPPSARAPRLIALLLGVLFLSGVHVEPQALEPALFTESMYDREFNSEIHVRLDPEARASLEARPRQYVWAEVEHQGLTQRARLRIKGHRSKRRLDEKPAFKIEFPPTRGVRTLALNNLVEDPTAEREALAYAWLSELGMPVPRTTYARLRFDGVDKGLYLIVEPLDDDFIASRAGAPGDLLYEGEYGCDIQSSDVGGFDLDAGKDKHRRRLAAFAERAEDPRHLFDPDQGPLDLPAFLQYLAASSLIGDFDGYRHAHNYYLHYRAASDKWSLLPWGLDRAFTKRVRIDDSQGVLARRCFQSPSCKREYARTLQALATSFESFDLPARARDLAARIDEHAGPEQLDDARRREVNGAREKLEAYLRERPAQIRRQLSCLDPNGKELDRDGDGHGCTDCNDENPNIYPGAKEGCNSVDDDCTGLIDDAPQCSCEVVSIEGAHYHFCDLPMPWPEAERFCRQKGLALARIDSKPLSKALYSEGSRIDDQRWWIGYSDAEVEGAFRWRDGTPGTFTYWAKTEPDNGNCNADCAALRAKGNGRWQDTHCNQHRPFICGPATPVLTHRRDGGD